MSPMYGSRGKDDKWRFSYLHTYAAFPERVVCDPGVMRPPRESEGKDKGKNESKGKQKDVHYDENDSEIEEVGEESRIS